MTLTQKQQSVLNVMVMLAVTALFFFIPNAYAGGLDAATDKANEVKTWAYGFILVCTIIYALYCIGAAFVHRGSWGDVAMAFVYGAIAGGIVKGISWAQTIFQ
ncbi:conjugal transfer protein TraC [Bisgaard Taxon 10/6]|uniref:conjugal transfer protein TraC n=1 Tax=Exercitatus varius TaxID=67857 RepID=UPI00294AA2FB|nr:conjugal transfer protein TraC [Exercitatus varius]MDG2957043.1 conjugal transfer protein TraC [Exercitatus varius]MDG2965269.1 conjugal transfer protein TraC [Exercitatus varius]